MLIPNLKFVFFEVAPKFLRYGGKNPKNKEKHKKHFKNLIPFANNFFVCFLSVFFKTDSEWEVSLSWSLLVFDL